MSDNEDFYNSPKFRALADAKRAFEESASKDETDIQRKIPNAITDVAGVNYVAGYGGLSGSIGLPSDDLQDVIVTMRHARVFITSREKMHPTGIQLYDELLAKLEAHSLSLSRPHSHGEL